MVIDFYTSSSRRTHTNDAVIDPVTRHQVVIIVNSQQDIVFYVDCFEFS